MPKTFVNEVENCREWSGPNVKSTFAQRWAPSHFWKCAIWMILGLYTIPTL